MKELVEKVQNLKDLHGNNLKDINQEDLLNHKKDVKRLIVKSLEGLPFSSIDSILSETIDIVKRQSILTEVSFRKHLE